MKHIAHNNNNNENNNNRNRVSYTLSSENFVVQLITVSSKTKQDETERRVTWHLKWYERAPTEIYTDTQ